MNTCEYAGDSMAETRSHPWIDTVDNSACRYYDLTASPELIRTSLEDFKPFEHHAAVEEFYLMLTELNQPQSGLESNDCAFLGPHKNSNSSVAKPLQTWGRVMILFRHLTHNTEIGNLKWITSELHQYLAVHDDPFKWGMIGTTIVPVRYLALGKYEKKQAGFQLMISFWAWGNSEKESMTNTARVVRNLSGGLKHLSGLAAQG